MSTYCNHRVRIHGTSCVASKIDKKMENLGVLSTMSSIYRMSSILTIFEHKNNNEKKQKRTKKWRTLNPSLHFGSPNPKLSFKPSFFCRDQLIKSLLVGSHKISLSILMYFNNSSNSYLMTFIAKILWHQDSQLKYMK
jgi:hypothetical protein